MKNDQEIDKRIKSMYDTAREPFPIHNFEMQDFQKEFKNLK